MISTEFMNEDVSGIKFTYKEEGDWASRIYITMIEHPTDDIKWLMPNPREVGEMALDLNPKDKSVYLNRIDITSGQGHGRGKVLLAEALDRLRKHGYKTATAYVNHNNPNSQGLFRSAGFEIAKSDEWDAQYGDYWAKTL